MKAHQLINQDSGDTEYYTPVEIIKAAHDCMGRIDLDPASSYEQAKMINAYWQIFTKEQDGLKQNWFGNVWMNHPFSRTNNKLFVQKIVSEYEKGNIKQACMICYASTSELWFQPLLDYPICFIRGRVNYLKPDGKVKKGVTKGSVVVYFGENIAEFEEAFSSFGKTKI